MSAMMAYWMSTLKDILDIQKNTSF